ncbi:MAG: AraC family transcriptional regulator ligand-binding domain-containing protein [Paraglaciecola sp.]|uniref:AraC family transcriptional regulator n=1 Tax=Paraglaciecola sp. TaxID=1920173 RepID=UPI0032975A41
MLDLVKATSLNKFDSVVKEFGGDHQELMRQVNLPSNLLDTPEIYFQYADFITLLNLTASKLSKKDLGLYLGSKQGIEIFGSVGYLIKNCETVGEALLNLKRFFHIHHTSADIGFSVAGSEVKLSFNINIKTNESILQATDLAISFGLNMLMTLTSSKIRYDSIHLQHAEPDNKEDYRRYLGIMPTFNSTFNGAVFNVKVLDIPIDKADPKLFDILSAQLTSSATGYIDEIPQFVENFVRQNIASTSISIEEIASVMALSVRNLQRYLKEQNTSFRQIVDTVRNKLACQYLIDSTLSLTHISDVLGFSNYSEFSRSFKRWNKISPKEYRVQYSPRKRFSRSLKYGN